MATVLYITANPKPVHQSYSLSVAEEFLNAYRQVHPQDEVIELDLYKIDIPYIDLDVFSGWGKLQQGSAFEELSADEKAKVSRINELTEQFVAADKYVFVTPMWNFSIPPKMKAYIDTICIAGKTFKYTEQGPVGLLPTKKAVHIQARGGVYSEGPARDSEFGDRYIRAVLNFLGVTNVESVIVEGMNQMPQEAESIKAKAIEHAREVAKRF
ncbi:FMN-dependent NADH-azoreductase [Thermoflavimicrobium dichotomicum]|uniref:FMN dependent NADH:quinone oxidoreductase n=1 Tax=Thermoflavimicrobium dichotomicum TaxID=46223 RepID=A0A1I3LKV2_9BACL|nr:FMN-dependent NADH-azoreductase [Thermoflavimicrobium dichotomicum]SFI85096.1 FMN-dependent NADH-azoreductase [Thermoflavimicrobium dichotomicum]